MDQYCQLNDSLNAPKLDQVEDKEDINDGEKCNLKGGDVNSIVLPESATGTVLHEKLVYYCSAFDLNVNEWFNEYENTEIFKRRMKLKLGLNWIKYFYQAIDGDQINENQDPDDSEDIWSEDTEEFASNQCLNIAIEYYLVSAKNNIEENSFDNFYEGIQNYFVLKGYKIIDESLFKSLVHTFHIIAEGEEENISKKKKTDENFDKEYKKSSRRRELKHQEKEEQEEEIKDHRVKNNFIQESVHKRKIRNMIPGFSVIKNRIITPLLIASERVVEYMIPEKSQTIEINNKEDQNEEIDEDGENQEHLKFNTKFQKLSLEDIERKQRKRTLKLLRKSNQNINISTNLINKASDCVEFISERMPGESKVTRSFVTNMIELSDTAMKRIAAACNDQIVNNEGINMRFITPSKKFYNLLMSVWIKMDPTSIFNLTETAFIENSRQAIENEKLTWSEAYIEPTKAFFKIAKEEFMNLCKIQRNEAEMFDQESTNFSFSMSRFFTSIKSTLLEMWNSEIVNKSAMFTSASLQKDIDATKPQEVTNKNVAI